MLLLVSGHTDHPVIPCPEVLIRREWIAGQIGRRRLPTAKVKLILVWCPELVFERTTNEGDPGGQKCSE
jgi:hypothetical protein